MKNQDNEADALKKKKEKEAKNKDIKKNFMDAVEHQEEKPYIPRTEDAGTEPIIAEKIEYRLDKQIDRTESPYLVWKDKYEGEGELLEEKLAVDLRSLYIKETIYPEDLIKSLYHLRDKQGNQQSLIESFGHQYQPDELNKPALFYNHPEDWTNRMIAGDSLLVMNSLLHKENFAGKVQTIYIDPPYGIKYNSNWQKKQGDRNVKDGADESLSHEPEVIKAYRDTWEQGIHSYLAYLRDRLLVAHDLLHESGSVFVQISDENVHLVRCLMDEVFGSENFVRMITVKKTAGLGTDFMPTITDYIIWYAKDIEKLKYRNLYKEKQLQGDSAYSMIEFDDFDIRRMTKEENQNHSLLPLNAKIFRYQILLSAGRTESCIFPIEYNQKVFFPTASRSWATNKKGIDNLIKKNRIALTGNTLSYIRYANDFPINQISNFWDDTASGSGMDKIYTVQTSTKVIERCLLMTTDPGDLVLDITCGSGTTAYVAEQWGRRWITCDTSRIALNIAKTRLTTAVFPYYYLKSEVEVFTSNEKGKIKKSVQYKPDKHTLENRDVRQGFVYEEVPHITLKSLANDEPPETETLYDKPLEDKKKMRVAGPFTVEILQAYQLVNPETAENPAILKDYDDNFEALVFAYLQNSGIKNGRKNETIKFIRLDKLTSSALNAIGYYQVNGEDKTAYFHIGPKFNEVSRLGVNQAVAEARKKYDCDWLIILGFAFANDVEEETITMGLGTKKVEVSKVRMNDDLLQNGLFKKDKKGATFVLIGEPEIDLIYSEDRTKVQIEIKGMDIYDPVNNQVKATNQEDIAHWYLDDDYENSNFIVRQIFFCGADEDKYKKVKSHLEKLASAREKGKKMLEATLKIEIDEDAFDRLYGYVSHPIEVVKGKRIAVRVVSHWGEECTKVIEL